MLIFWTFKDPFTGTSKPTDRNFKEWGYSQEEWEKHKAAAAAAQRDADIWGPAYAIGMVAIIWGLGWLLFH